MLTPRCGYQTEHKTGPSGERIAGCMGRKGPYLIPQMELAGGRGMVDILNTCFYKLERIFVTNQKGLQRHPKS